MRNYPLGEKGAHRTDYSARVLCPRCWERLLPDGYPGSISRADRATEICPECGVDEALNILVAPEDWPVGAPRVDGLRRHASRAN